MSFRSSSKRGISKYFALVALTFMATANAGLLVNDAGQLYGATNVNVQGIFYDVEFVNGTCAEIFSGCDHPLDFAFYDLGSVRAAGFALLAQVLVDGNGYFFDSYPTTMAGCGPSEPGAVHSARSICWIHTPFSRLDAMQEDGSADRLLRYDLVMNTGSEHIDMDGVIGAGPGGAAIFPSTGGASTTWARWTQPTSVPEPSTLALFACALAGIGLMRRRRAAE